MAKNTLYLILFLSILICSTSCTYIGYLLNSSQTFQNSNITFEYPQEWETFSEFWPAQFGFNYTPNQDFNGSELAAVLDPRSSTPQEKYTTWTKIYRINRSKSLDYVVNKTYFSLNSSITLITKRNININNQTALEVVYQKFKGENRYQVRDIWLENGADLYIISCWTLPVNYEEAQPNFNKIIESFKVN